MRRTTSRSSNRTGARRASSSRSKRSKRAARPRLISRQLRAIAGGVIALIVTIHFSPGALLATAVGTLRAAYAERTRIRDLVAAPGAEKPKTARPVAASNDLLTRSAASFATAPATPDHPSIWDVDEPDDTVERKPPPAQPDAVAVEGHPAPPA